MVEGAAPSPRYYHAAVSISNRVLVIGGVAGGKQFESLSTVYELKPHAPKLFIWGTWGKQYAITHPFSANYIFSVENWVH